MRTSKTPIIYYICDRTACCPCKPDCKYTCNVADAKNFIADESVVLTPRGHSVKKNCFFENEYDNTGGGTVADIPEKGSGR